MKTIDTAKIRQLLNNAQVQVRATIEWAKYPGGAEEHGNKALNLLEEALALLPCETCNGTGKKMAGGCFGMVHKEIPCPDCQKKSKLEKPNG